MDTIVFIYQLASLKNAFSHKRTAANYCATARALARFLHLRKRPGVDLRALTRELIADFEHHLLCERRVCRNTSSFYLRQLRAVYNEAVRRQLCADRRLFDGVYTGVAATVKRSAKPEALKQLFELRLECRPELEFARDLFYFAFLGRGIAFVDLAKLQVSDIDGSQLTYHRSKPGQLICVDLLPAMQRIIRRWHHHSHTSLFPILPPEPSESDYATALRRYNRHLAVLTTLCRSEVNLTSYTARHSWASEAYRLGVPIQTISECMGHTTEQTTRIYIRALSEDFISSRLRPLVDAYN